MVDNNSLKVAYDNLVKYNTAAAMAQHTIDQDKADGNVAQLQKDEAAYNYADEDAHAQQVAMQEIKKSLAQDKIDIANAEKNLSTAVNLSHKTAEELQHAETILGKDEQELQTDQATLDKLKETLNKMNSANDDLDQAKQDLQNAQKELDNALNQNNIDKIALQKDEAELQALEDTTITTVTNTRELGNSFTLTTPSSTTAATSKMMNNANAEAATINDGAKKMPTRAEYRASLPTTGDDNNEEASVFGAIVVAISGLIANFGLARKKREN